MSSNLKRRNVPFSPPDMTEDEAKDMETRQSAVLEHLNITR